jgi:hypothetical protein
MPTENAEQAAAEVKLAHKVRRLNLRGVLQASSALSLAVVVMRSDIRIAKLYRTHEWLTACGSRVFRGDLVDGLSMASDTGARQLQFNTGRLFVYYLIGIFFTNFVPGGGVSGDVARLIYVDRDVRDKALVLSTLVYERLIGVFTLLLIGLGATLMTRAYGQTNPMIYATELILALAFISIAILMSESMSSRLARFIR